MKKRIGLTWSAGLALVLITAVVWMGIGVAGAGKVTRISFGSSGVGAVFHVMVGGFAPHASQALKDIEVTAEATRGSVENIRLIASKKTEMAFVAGTVLYLAQKNRGHFKKETHPELRGVSVVYVGINHWVTLAKSGIRTMMDLRGKRVSIGPPGSAIAASSLRALRKLGIEKKVKIRRLGWAESATALKDGNIDAFSVASALPVPSVVNVAATHKIRILPIDPGLMEKMKKSSPANFLCKIPAGTYKGVDEDVPMSCYEAFWMAHQDVPEDVVYRLLKFAYKPPTRKYLENVHPGWKMLKPGIESMTKVMGLKLHPGAEKYYREVGVIK
jgi:TRAP transporter TAXI family solute receptor